MAAADESVRRTSARIAALTRWAKVADPSAATAPARRGLMARFEREVDPDGTLAPVERTRRAERLQRAHMSRMSLAAAAKRRAA